MKTISDLFSSSIVQSLGWALLHSIWQAFLIFVVISLLLRVVKTSSWRYRINLAGLSLIVLLSISTFIYLQSVTAGVPITSSAHAVREHAVPVNVWHADFSQTTTLKGVLQSNMNIIVVCWIIGTVLFSLRVAGGGLYVSMLRRNAIVITGLWSSRLAALTNQFSIQRIITLAESVKVQTPIVLGYLKPIIILPAGMLSGLSSEQVEMILLHELMHIKRHDYLVNIGQMIVESVLFFNPFVWMLSEEIRKEREHCCDDAVVHHHPNALAYATTLVQLEAARISRIEPALGLAQNKKQLLNRIQRLMENSVKNYSARSRVVPAVLLVIGLICASWLTISREPNTLSNHSDNLLVAQDTSAHPKNKKGSYSRTRIVTTDENGEPREEIIESYDGDYTSFMVSPVQPPDMPGIPDFEIPDPPDFPDFPGVPDFIFEYDTIPGNLSYSTLQDFEKFSKEFEANFIEQFGCIKKIQDFESEFSQEISAQANSDIQRQMAQHHAEVMIQNLEHHARAMTEHQAALARMNEDLANWEEEHSERMKEVEKNLQRMNENMEAFEKEIQKELVKDGYLKADEKIDNMHWNTKGEIEINGKKLRDEHLKKYNQIHDKFFNKEDITPDGD